MSRTDPILGPAKYIWKPLTFGNIKQMQVFCSAV